MKKLAFVFAVLLMASCSKEEKTASVQFRLTDAPGSYDAVLIDISSIEVIAGDAPFTVNLVRPGVYNLLDFTNGIDTLLADIDLPEGRMNQVRLILGNNNSVVVDGDTFALATPSAQQSGLKLNVQYDLVAGVNYQFVLDFDAGRSIVRQGNGGYLLKPVIRVFTNAQSGAIRGHARPDSAAVYVMAIAGTDTFGTIPPADGRFLLKGLPAGSYNVVVQGGGSLGDLSINNVGVTIGNVTDLGEVSF
ncbi:MAG: DUF4382 domain-containing protein [Sphingobacteriaceae bacterium]|nr:DUF4382 domain-containing protein [Sphingobacteriaceae bacterium]